MPATFKSYQAVLTQPNSSSAPIANTLISGFSTPFVWGRNQPGQYYTENPGKLTINKTYSPPFGDGNGGNNSYLPILRSDGVIIGYYTIYSNNDGDTMGLNVFDTQGNLVELSSLINNTGLFVEIRVYP